MAAPWLSRIEDAAINASAPPEQRWLDGWLLRFSPGKAKRARCIHALAEGSLALAERLALAQAAYDEAGLPILLRCTPFTQPPALTAKLQALGWRSFDDTRVMLWPDYRCDAPGAFSPRIVTGAAYAKAVGALRGTAAAEVTAHARRLAASPVPHRGALWREGGRVLACGQYAREGDLVGLYDVMSVPEARGRGLATRLCRWLLARAAAEGARHAYLQVSADNEAAIALYRRLGFADAYGYHYLTPEPDPARVPGPKLAG